MLGYCWLQNTHTVKISPSCPKFLEKEAFGLCKRSICNTMMCWKQSPRLQQVRISSSAAAMDAETKGKKKPKQNKTTNKPPYLKKASDRQESPARDALTSTANP